MSNVEVALGFVNPIRGVSWKISLVISSLWFFVFLACFAQAQQPPAETAAPKEKPLFGEVLRESLFGDPTDNPWRPLPLETFFNEGWDESFDYPIDGSGGAPRQGWINALDGVFYRLWFLSYTFADNFHDNGNQQTAAYTLFAPVNRRFQFRFDIPFFFRNRGGQDNDYHTNFGDFIVTPRFLLSETQDFTQIFAVPVRTPTGDTENGNGVASVTPQYEFWYNVSNGWVARGGIGTTLPTKDDLGRYTFNFNFAVGQILTPHDLTPIGDLWLYVATDGFTTLDNRADSVTSYSLTPAFRSHLGLDWYLLGGVELPVTGPPSQSFDYEPNVWLMKVW